MDHVSGQFLALRIIFQNGPCLRAVPGLRIIFQNEACLKAVPGLRKKTNV